MRSGVRLLTPLVAFTLLGPMVSLSQERRPPRSDDHRGEVVELTGTLVNVPVLVRDSHNRYIANLTKEDFHLFEDGVEQEIAFFSNTEEPISVALLLDTSGSTREELPRIREAAIEFVSQLHDSDRVMVVSFDDDIDVGCELTNDRREMIQAIRRTRSGGSTHLYDAVSMVVSHLLRDVPGRKAIVLFTDGVDTASRGATAESTIAELEESNVLVYSIRYDTQEAVARRMAGSGGVLWGRIPFPIPSPTPRSSRGIRWPLPWPNRGPFPGVGRLPLPVPYPLPRRGPQPSPRPDDRIEAMYRRGEAYLRELAERTGGVLYHAETLSDLPSVFEQIAEQLRHQYTLGYYPSQPTRDGRYRRIRVTVDYPDAHVRARPGYRAPTR